MIDPAPLPSRGRLGLSLALVALLAAAGWLAGRATRPAPLAEAPAARGPTERAAIASAPRPELPSLAPAGAAAPAADVLHPRPADEWQGMRVDLTQRQDCEASSHCGFALACLPDQKCGACTRDDQCDTGEVCVLDHCLVAANARCRSRADCTAAGPDALCQLSGLSGGDPRGNAGMRSYCQGAAGRARS